MRLEAADRKKLVAVLEALARGVEDLVRSGLTTASESTRRELGVAFQEASRLRLLRLGSTLRVANEELGRFTKNDPGFSRRRLMFFLNRAWLLSRGMSRAITDGDDRELEKLLHTPTSTPVKKLEVVTLGVAKRVAPGAFVAFEFRLRSLPDGQRLVWSCVFPVKAGSKVPPEGYLHLPQKQKFKPIVLCEHKRVVIERALVSADGRLSLADASRISEGKNFDDWQRFQSWDPNTALERLRAHQPGPFDLDIELQEEVVLEDWSADSPAAIRCGRFTFEATIPEGPEGVALGKALERARKKKKRSPLFGVMHYEKRRLMLQPLALFDKDGPEYLTLSREKLDPSALLRALEF